MLQNKRIRVETCTFHSIHDMNMNSPWNGIDNQMRWVELKLIKVEIVHNGHYFPYSPSYFHVQVETQSIYLFLTHCTSYVNRRNIFFPIIKYLRYKNSFFFGIFEMLKCEKKFQKNTIVQTIISNKQLFTSFANANPNSSIAFCVFVVTNWKQQRNELIQVWPFDCVSVWVFVYSCDDFSPAAKSHRWLRCFTKSYVLVPLM